MLNHKQINHNDNNKYIMVDDWRKICIALFTILIILIAFSFMV